MDSEKIKIFHPRFKSLLNWGARNGVYYYLGGVGSHISHALPVYRKIGGIFIVTSQEAYDSCRKLNVSVIMVDNRPDLFLQFPFKELKNTINYLNTHAKVITFYEIFSIHDKLVAPQIMLAHGVGFKDYYIEWRRAYLPYFKYISGLGKYWESRILTQGVKKEQIAKVGVARMDSVMKMKGRVYRQRTARRLGLNPRKEIISYVPTWWGPTSVNDTGKTIIRMLSEEYSLIFRPHPSTPSELIQEYEDIIQSEKLNAVYVPDGKYKNVDINDIYRASSAFIVDMSSVSIEAMMTDKPILFAFGGKDRDQGEVVYKPIQRFYNACQHITGDDAHLINKKLKKALEASIDRNILENAKLLFTYSLKGTSTINTAKLIKDTAIKNS